MDPRAGQPATAEDLVDVAKLVTVYYTVHPDPADAAQKVSFGTSGHRGSAFSATFNEDHILATTQAICEYRAGQGIDGPVYLGADSHALSEPATASALEVLAANDVRVLIDSRGGYTPTPAVSRAILAHNAGGPKARADGIGVTPSHNPPPPGGVPGHPGPHRRRAEGPGGRDRGHAVAQPAPRRRVQVQPARRRTGRDRHHQVDPGPGQRTAGRRADRRAPGPAGPGPGRRHDREVRLPGPVRHRATRGHRPGRDPGRRGAHRRGSA